MEDFKKDIYGLWGDLNPVTFPYPDASYINEKSKIYKYYIRKFLPQNKDINILDLGCGYGIFIKSCLDLGYKNVFGIEFIEKCVNFTKDKLGINTVKCGDIVDYLKESPKEHFDVITAFDVIEHFDKHEIMNLFRLIYDKIKPGGVFLMQVPNGGSLGGLYIMHSDLTHEWAYTDFLINELFYIIGFKDIIVESELQRTRGLRGLVRYILRKFAALILGMKSKLIFSTNIIAVGYKK